MVRLAVERFAGSYESGHWWRLTTVIDSGKPIQTRVLSVWCGRRRHAELLMFWGFGCMVANPEVSSSEVSNSEVSNSEVTAR